MQLATLQHFNSVIHAAERGDYCHGNGAVFVFVDRFRKTLVSVNVITGDTTTADLNTAEAVSYLAGTPAHRDQGVADRLRAHVINTLKASGWTEYDTPEV